jgi:eukaryotic-like serine/threonine-protein kinase
VALSPGARLGPYEIVDRIGAGGMGEVYRARDARLDRTVALKVLPDMAAASDMHRSRLLREARAAAALTHPNIVAIYDIGRDTGIDYVAMEHVAGAPLAQRIPPAGLPVDQVLDVGLQMAAAAAAAHQAGLVHRDIKPSNVLLTPTGLVKVVDFGLAKDIPGSRPDLPTVTAPQTLTTPGVFCGTPGYAAPEQVKGLPADARSDVFAIGAVLYEMLTGRRAFGGDSIMSVLAAVLERSAPPLHTVRRDVPTDLAAIVGRCLEKTPAARYASAVDLQDDLAACRARLARRPGGPRAFFDWSRRLPRSAEPAGNRSHSGHQVPAARSAGPTLSARRRGLIAAALVIVVFAGLGWWRWSSSSLRLPASPQLTSLAVLPLENRSNGADHQFFAEGMTDELISQLQRIEALRVRSRTSVSAYKGSGKRLPEIARELGVDAIVEGSVNREGDRVRITVRLIGANTDTPLWGSTYERDLRDALTLQREVAIAVATHVDVALTPGEVDRAARTRTVSPEVLDLFFRGRHLAARHNKDDLVAATGALERAVQLDPQFARAHGVLALAYVLRAFNFEPEREAELTAAAEAAAGRALAIDPGVADAHVARGRLIWTRRNGFPHLEAAREFRRAIELNPGSATALGDLALVYNHIGLLDLALSATGDALAIDPSENRALLQMGFVLLSQGRAADALAVLRRIPPGFHPSVVASHEAWALLELGLSDEATARVDRALEEFPADQGGELAAMKAFLAARAGQDRASEALIAQARQKDGYGHFHHTAYFITWTYARLGQPASAVEWLRDTARQGWPCYPLFARDPHLDPLRGDPRFEALLQEIRAEWERYRMALASHEY